MVLDADSSCGNDVKQLLSKQAHYANATVRNLRNRTTIGESVTKKHTSPSGMFDTAGSRHIGNPSPI